MCRRERWSGPRRRTRTHVGHGPLRHVQVLLDAVERGKRLRNALERNVVALVELADDVEEGDRAERATDAPAQGTLAQKLEVRLCEDAERDLVVVVHRVGQHRLKVRAEAHLEQPFVVLLRRGRDECECLQLAELVVALTAVALRNRAPERQTRRDARVGPVPRVADAVYGRRPADAPALRTVCRVEHSRV
jgi:hypothetical protein